MKSVQLCCKLTIIVTVAVIIGGCMTELSSDGLSVWDKDFLPYRVTFAWHLCQSLDMSHQCSLSLDAVPDSFSFREASWAFSCGFEQGATGKTTTEQAFCKLMGSDNIVDRAYEEGVILGMISKDGCFDKKLMVDEYYSLSKKVWELSMRYWADPLSFAPTNLMYCVRRQKFTQAEVAGLLIRPSINPYETLWQNFSNSYMRTTFALSNNKDRIRGGDAGERCQSTASLMVIEASVIPEYRAYAYGHWQALSDNASLDGNENKALIFKVDTMKEIESGLYVFLRDKMAKSR